MEPLINLIIINFSIGVVIAELCRYRYHTKNIGKFSRVTYVIIVFVWFYFLIRFIYRKVRYNER